MIVTSLARALSHALLDAAIADASARRAAKAGVDAGLAPAALALGDVAGAVEAGVGAATKATAAAVNPDAEVSRALDFVEQEAGRLASGNFVAALVESGSEKAVGATGGGIGEAATDGEIEVMDGLSLSRGLVDGLVGSDGLDRVLGERALRAGAGLAAGGAATALADPEDGADAFRYGAQLGLRLDGIRVDDDAVARAFGAAELAVEWGVAGGVRSRAVDVAWTEALGFGRRLSASAGAMMHGAVRSAAPLAEVPGSTSAENGWPSATDGRGPTGGRSRGWDVRLAALTTAAGGAAGLTSEVASFVAHREAAARSRVAVARGDEHSIRAAHEARFEAASLDRLRGVGAGLDRAAGAMRDRVPRADEPEARDQPFESKTSKMAERRAGSMPNQGSESLEARG
jgi:hypothetical protein